MYATIALFRPLPGQEQALIAMFERWWHERQPRVPGLVGAWLLRNEFISGELTSIVIFDSAEHFDAYMADPERERWTRDFWKLIERGEERRIDGPVVSGYYAGDVARR